MYLRVQRHLCVYKEVCMKRERKSVWFAVMCFAAVLFACFSKPQKASALATTQKVEMPFSVNYEYLSYMQSGNSLTYEAKFDFDGDGKKDKLTVECKKLSSGSVDLTTKINGKNCFKTSYYPDESEIYSFSTFDVNPGNKRKELAVIRMSYISDETQLYRFTGKKVKKVQSFSDMSIWPLKQKKNDKLQVSYSLDIPQIGGTTIHTSLKTDNKIVINSTGIYNCESNSTTKYEFCKQITLFKSADCKQSDGYIPQYACGSVTKIKLDKTTGRVVSAYVVLTNGKKGWIKLKPNWDWEELLVTNHGFAG